MVEVRKVITLRMTVDQREQLERMVISERVLSMNEFCLRKLGLVVQPPESEVAKGWPTPPDGSV